MREVKLLRKTRTTARYATRTNVTRRKTVLKKRRWKSGHKKGTKAYTFVIPSKQLMSQAKDGVENGAENGMSDAPSHRGFSATDALGHYPCYE